MREQSLGFMAWNFMRRNAWKDCELAHKKGEQLYKVCTPCMDDHHLKKEELETVGELSKICSQIVLECLFLAPIGRPDILWCVNNLARAVRKWTKPCDKRLARLISHIHHTSHHMWVIRCNIVDWDCSKTQTLLETLKILNQPREEFCVSLEVERSFPKVGCARNKFQSLTVQPNLKFFLWTQVLRMDGIPTLDLWGLVTEVLHSSKNLAVRVDPWRDETPKETHQHQDEETRQPKWY